jgi:hypothetical protein
MAVDLVTTSIEKRVTIELGSTPIQAEVQAIYREWRSSEREWMGSSRVREVETDKKIR